jgi:hypothetical protein
MTNLRSMTRVRDDNYVLSATPSFKPLAISTVHEDNDISMPQFEYDGRRMYTLEMRLFTKFACNTAEREYAEENAHKQIQRMVYQNMEDLLYEARAAVYAGQEEQAMKAIHAALDECRG